MAGLAVLGEYGPFRWREFLNIRDKGPISLSLRAEDDFFVGKEVKLSLSILEDNFRLYDLVVLGKLIIKPSKQRVDQKAPSLKARNIFVAGTLICDGVDITCDHYARYESTKSLFDILHKLLSGTIPLSLSPNSFQNDRKAKRRWMAPLLSDPSHSLRFRRIQDNEAPIVDDLSNKDIFVGSKRRLVWTLETDRLVVKDMVIFGDVYIRPLMKKDATEKSLLQAHNVYVIGTFTCNDNVQFKCDNYRQTDKDTFFKALESLIPPGLPIALNPFYLTSKPRKKERVPDGPSSFDEDNSIMLAKTASLAYAFMLESKYD